MPDIVLSNIGEMAGVYGGAPESRTSKAVTTLLVDDTLNMDKTADRPVWADGKLLYTITINNYGVEDYTEVTFTDTLDPLLITLDDVYGVLLNGEAVAHTFDGPSGLLSVTNLEIAAGTEAVITFQVQKITP